MAAVFFGKQAEVTDGDCAGFRKRSLGLMSMICPSGRNGTF